MVRNYKKKTDRCNISETNMKKAIKDVLRKTSSGRLAAFQHGVARTTLQSRLKKIRLNNLVEKYLESDDSDHEEEETMFSSKYATRQVFNSYEERQLVEYIKKCSEMNYALTYDQIRKLAYDFALTIENCPIPPQWMTAKEAGLDWVQGLMKRHRDISLRKPKSTSLSRASAFKESGLFAHTKEKLTDQKIWDIDESSVYPAMKLKSASVTTPTMPIITIAAPKQPQKRRKSSASCTTEYEDAKPKMDWNMKIETSKFSLEKEKIDLERKKFEFDASLKEKEMKMRFDLEKSRLEHEFLLKKMELSLKYRTNNENSTVEGIIDILEEGLNDHVKVEPQQIE